MSIRVTILAGLLAAAATGLVVSAVSAEPVAHVRYADLDLRSPVGEKMLARRIALVADRVCDEGVASVSVQRCHSDLDAQGRDRTHTTTAQGL